MDPPTAEEIQESEEFITRIHELTDQVVNNIQLGDMDLEKVKVAQESDPELAEVITWIRGAVPSKEELKTKSEDLQSYFGILKSLYLDEAGVARMKHRCATEIGETKEKLLVPNNNTELKDFVFLHSNSFGMVSFQLRSSVL